MTRENRLIIHRAFKCAFDEIMSNHPKDYLASNITYSIWYQDTSNKAYLEYSLNDNAVYITLYDNSSVHKTRIYPGCVDDGNCKFLWNENMADYESAGCVLSVNTSRNVWKSILYLLEEFDEIRKKPLFTQKDFIRSLSSWGK